MALEVIEFRASGREYVNIDAAINQLGASIENALETLTPVMKQEALEFLNLVFLKLQRLHGSPWNQQIPTGEDHLFRRSGRGLRDILKSIQAESTGPGEIAYRISASGYMAGHEDDKTIRPTSKTYLLIPLRAALDYRGLRRRTSPFNWGKTFVAKSKKGNLLIFQKRAGGKIVPLYLLKKEVRQRGKLHFKETFDSQLPYFEQRLFEAISEALEKNYGVAARP